MFHISSSDSSGARLSLLYLRRVGAALLCCALIGTGTNAIAQTITSARPVARPTVRAEAFEPILAPVVQAPGGAQALKLTFSSSFPSPRPDDFHKRAIRSGPSLVEDSGVSGVVSYAVADRGGDILEARGPIVRLPPASVAKAITAIYALEHLGGDYRFNTDVLITGPLIGGIVQGDVILTGSGDPTLDTDMLHSLAQKMEAEGVRGLTGDFYVHDAALPRVEQIDHEQTEYAGYNPTITGLNVNYNRVHFEWRKQGADYSFKMDARTDNRAPLVDIARMRIADRGSPVFDHTAAVRRDDWTVSRRALGNAGARWLPVRLPSLYAGELFVTLSKALGMTLPDAKRLDTLPAQTTLLARQESVPLTIIARDMLKYSTNLTAEIIGLTATQARGILVSDLAFSAQAMSDWAAMRLGARHLKFVDHSGLGGASVVSTSDMVRLLSAPGVEALLAPILKPIAVLDADRNLLKNSGISIAAKTGTLDFVSTLAGYVTAPDGRRMAFAIFTGDLPRRVAAKASGAAVPQGARTFNTRAKKLQQVLIQRWAAFYGS